MDVGTMNDIGITLAGIIGVGIFYYVGRRANDERQNNGSRPVSREGSSSVSDGPASSDERKKQN